MVSESSSRILTRFSTENGLVGWVDILGVRDMARDRRELLYESLSAFGAQFAVNYFKASGQDFPVNETNALMVGDALLFVQSSEAPGSRLFVIHSVLSLSKDLFSAGFPHRGYITQGSYRADHPDRGLPFITGEAVIDAVSKEQSLKLTGIATDENVMPTIKGLRGQAGHLYWTKSSLLGKPGYYLISSNLHMSRWKPFCNDRFSEHSYIAAAKAIVDQEDLWDM